MTGDDKGNALVGCGLIAVIAVIAAGGLSLSWYDAGVKADVYRREGIEISQWEVWRGARPAAREITVKQK